MGGLQFRHAGAIYRLDVQGAEDPLDVADSWLWDTLTGDATLAGLVAAGQSAEGNTSDPEAQWLYGDVGAEDTPEPYVRIWLEGAANGDRVFGGAFKYTLYYGVASISQTAAYSGLTAINKRIRELIDNESVDREDGSIQCWYVRPWRQAEVLG